MTHLLKVTLLGLSICLLSTMDLSAQNDNNEQYFEESGNFASRLWYGGGFTLGLNSGTGFSNFIFGLSPMVGYKITDQLSVGPRIGFEYQFLKGDACVVNSNGGVTGEVVRDGRGTTSFHGGVFSRFRAFENFFAHVELEIADVSNFIACPAIGVPLYYNQQTEDLLVIRETRENVYVGVGYTSGYPTGFEMLVLYNLTEPEDSFNSPFQIRLGMNHKF